MWLNTELKICYLSLEAVTEGHSLNNICNNQGKRNFPTEHFAGKLFQSLSKGIPNKFPIKSF